jgi:hypothetical protein
VYHNIAKEIHAPIVILRKLQEKETLAKLLTYSREFAERRANQQIK